SRDWSSDVCSSDLWAAQPGAIESVRPGAFLIYVKVPPAVAANRLAGADPRPLLAGPNPLDRMRALLAEREPFYLKADAEVVNDRAGPEVAAQAVAAMVRQYAGW